MPLFCSYNDEEIRQNFTLHLNNFPLQQCLCFWSFHGIYIFFLLEVYQCAVFRCDGQVFFTVSLPSVTNICLNLLFFLWFSDYIHFVLCNPKTCMGLWKTGSYSEGRPRVGGIFFQCALLALTKQLPEDLHQFEIGWQRNLGYCWSLLMNVRTLFAGTPRLLDALCQQCCLLLLFLSQQNETALIKDCGGEGGVWGRGGVWVTYSKELYIMTL